MAKEINIAPSSFYHYFSTKEEFMNELLDYWHEEGSMKIIKAVFLEDDPYRSVALLFKLIFEENFIYECFLLQLRAASYKNKVFLKKVNETDKLRVSFLTSLLARYGLNENEARAKANRVHNYVTGLHTSANLIEPDKKSRQKFVNDLQHIFEIIKDNKGLK